MKIEITADSKGVQSYFEGVAKRQMPFALMRTINDLAFKVREDVHQAMGGVFDRPKPNFTLRSIVVEKATKGNPSAWVGLRKDGGFRQSLSHHFMGGGRRFKKFEGWLRAMNVISTGIIAVATDNARKDAYGNQALSEIRAIMSASWRMDRVSKGFSATITRGRGKRAAAIGYFMIPTRNQKGLEPGVYRRIRAGKGTAVQMVVAFVKPGQYDRVIQLEEIAARAGVNVSATFAKHLSNAIATDKQLNRTLSR
jgi:hypothetical protein